jgi:hypothetical protein
MMGELIDRQAAIDMCRKPCMRNADCSDFEMEIMMLPSAQLDTYWKEQCQSYEKTINKLRESLSAQPEQRTGKWIKLDMHRGMADHKCTACEQECYVPTCMGEPLYAFCPNCGAKMEVNNEIN